jgi:malonyl-CoA/methylmalonyl-CoA synthetase
LIEPIQQARNYPDSIAILSEGVAHRYRDLADAAEHWSRILLDGNEDLNEIRVAFMVTPGFDYVATLWGIWQAGGVAVPLCLTHPLPSLRYTLEDSESTILIYAPEFESLLTPLINEKALRALNVKAVHKRTLPCALPIMAPTRRALILYTSGTTNLPKGVVTTHQNIQSQITTLIHAWKWNHSDHTLCILPLHHVHGLINVVSCSLWAGATCEFLPEFDAQKVFEIFLLQRVNVFMAVPTIYFKLITYWENLPVTEQEKITSTLTNFRLMVSGSAALPASVMEKWKDISHHTLLERYGMTELGMAISNPYEGERKTGFVGLPLPGVSIRLANEVDLEVHDEPGEIQVKGENVFLEYWNKPEATKNSFTPGGWFKTGDIAVVEQGYYRIMGRNSVDIIKSGGYKISALEIEEVLRTHPSVKDCAVVGVDNEEWGEIVAAAIVPAVDQPDLDLLRLWLKEQLPPYRVPRKFFIAKELPRNAMGKVTKNDVKKWF